MELNPQVKSTIDSVLAEFVDLKQRCPRIYHLGTVAEFEEYQRALVTRQCRELGLEPGLYLIYLRQELIRRGLR